MLRVRRQTRVIILGAMVYGGTLASVMTDRPSAAAFEATGGDGTRGQELAAEVERQIAAGNGCLTCHQPDTLSMHEAEKQITCVQCHGGNEKEPWNPANPRERVPVGYGAENAQVRARMQKAHVLPDNDDVWRSSANPERAG